MWQRYQCHNLYFKNIKIEDTGMTQQMGHFMSLNTVEFCPNFLNFLWDWSRYRTVWIFGILTISTWSCWMYIPWLTHMTSAPKEITFIKIDRSSKFIIHKISNTKHLSYTIKRRITLSSLFGFPSLSLINATLEHMCTRGKSSRDKTKLSWQVLVSITSKRDYFLFRLPPIELPPLSSAPLKNTPDEKAGEELDFNFLQ